MNLILKRSKFQHIIAQLLLLPTLTFTTQVSASSDKNTHMHDALYNSSFAKRYATERAVYQTAQQSLAQNPNFDLSKAKQQLANYPLLPFLEYAQLKAQFNQLPSEAIKAFQANHKNSYVERKLTADWMSYLGKNEQWQLFLSFNDSRFQNQSNQCYAERAKLSLSQLKVPNQASLQIMHKLWMTGLSLPKACDPVIEVLESRQTITSKDLWQRFELAYARKNDKLAHYLSKKLPPKAQEQADKLLQADNYSDYWLTQLSSSNQPLQLSSASYKRLLKTLAGVDNLGLAGLVENYRLPLTEKDWLSVKTLSAWYFAKSDANAALTWINQQQEKSSFQLQEKQLRYSMQAKNWPHFIASYEEADKKLKSTTEWQYWYALALLENPKNKKANTTIQQAEDILKQLAKRQDFYGLLAAKYYQQPLNIKDDIDLDNWTISNTTKDQLSAAIELYLLNEHLTAARQWYYSSKGFKRKQWREASAIAHQLQWHERMFRAIASSGFKTIINEQYPIAFEHDYSRQSSATGIDISWLLAMSRQESGFAPLAKSGKGAMGVMQLMPATAKRLAKELNLPYHKDELYEPSYNINLGSHYLQKLLARYDHNYVLATAAYNAGPHRVDEWLALRPIEDDWSHWIAAIPYKETRKYVQNILAFSHVYQQYLPNHLNGDLKLTLFQPQNSDDS